MSYDENKQFSKFNEWFLNRFPSVDKIWRNKKRLTGEVFTCVRLKSGETVSVKAPKVDSVELGALWAYTKACEVREKSRPTKFNPNLTSNYFESYMKRFSNAKQPIFGGMDFGKIKIDDRCKPLLDELKGYQYSAPKPMEPKKGVTVKIDKATRDSLKLSKTVVEKAVRKAIGDCINTQKPSSTGFHQRMISDKIDTVERFTGERPCKIVMTQKEFDRLFSEVSREYPLAPPIDTDLPIQTFEGVILDIVD